MKFELMRDLCLSLASTCVSVRRAADSVAEYVSKEHSLTHSHLLLLVVVVVLSLSSTAKYTTERKSGVYGETLGLPAAQSLTLSWNAERG